MIRRPPISPRTDPFFPYPPCFRSRIVMLVAAVPEAHQAERVVLVLGAGDIFGDALGPADFAQHVERRFVRAAMRGAPQAGDTRRDAGEGVGTRRAGEAYGRGRRILFVIGVEDEDAVAGALDGWHDFIFLRRHAEGQAKAIAP